MDSLDVKVLILLLYCRNSKKKNIYVTLSNIFLTKINVWTDLVYHFCLSASLEQGSLVNVYKNDNTISFLKTTFKVEGRVFMSDGLYKAIIPFKDDLELLEAVITAISEVLNISGYKKIDPFKRLDIDRLINIVTKGS